MIFCTEINHWRTRFWQYKDIQRYKQANFCSTYFWLKQYGKLDSKTIKLFSQPYKTMPWSFKKITNYGESPAMQTYYQHFGPNYNKTTNTHEILNGSNCNFAQTNFQYDPTKITGPYSQEVCFYFKSFKTFKIGVSTDYALGLY